MNRSHLFSLANYLSSYITFEIDDPTGTSGCNHSLRHTIDWIKANGVDQETCLGWLQQRGGWCDCSVVQHIFLADPYDIGDQAELIPPSAFKAWDREV